MSDRDGPPGWSDDAPVELLTSSSDRAGIDERLDGGVRRSGRWARRHPGWVLGAAVVALGGVALGVYLARRPPPEAPVLVSIQSLGGGSQYLVEPQTPGEEIRPVGIVGPGLTDPTSTIGRTTSTGPGLGNLGARVDCAGTWWEGRPEDYRARVERTDAYGRVRTYDAAIEGASGGDVWWSQVRHQCLSRAVSGLQPAPAEVVTEPDRRGLVVTAHLVNPNPFPLGLAVLAYGRALLAWSGEERAAIPAGGSGDLVARMTFDCSDRSPSLPAPGLEGGGDTAPVLGVPVGLVIAPPADGGDPDRRFGDGISGYSVVPLQPAAVQRIEQAVTAAC